MAEQRAAARGRGVGIIGASGGFGPFIASALAGMDGAYLAAVAGSHPQRTARAARDLGAAAAYTDWRALIADPTVEVVAICTPPAQHAVQAIAAAQAGKAVFLEKPAATTAPDARALQEAVERGGVVCVVDYVMRYNSLFERLKEWTASQAFGRLRRIDFQNFAGDEGLAPDHWFWDRRRSGGILIEHGVHFFDIYGHLVGAPPLVIRGMLTERPAPTASDSAHVAQEDKVLANVLYADGVLASYYPAFDKPSRLEQTTALLAYDRGYITVDGWIAMSLNLDVLVDERGYAALQGVPGLRLETIEQYHGLDQQVGGHGYTSTATRRARGVLAHAHSKEHEYRAEVQRALADLLAAMDDPAHRVRAPLAAGLASLEVALRATDDGRTAAADHPADRRQQEKEETQ